MAFHSTSARWSAQICIDVAQSDYRPHTRQKYPGNLKNRQEEIDVRTLGPRCLPQRVFRNRLTLPLNRGSEWHAEVMASAESKRETANPFSQDRDRGDLTKCGGPHSLAYHIPMVMMQMLNRGDRCQLLTKKGNFARHWRSQKLRLSSQIYRNRSSAGHRPPVNISIWADLKSQNLRICRVKSLEKSVHICTDPP